MKWLACAIAAAAFLLGIMALSLPEARQPYWGMALIAYGAVLVGLILFSATARVGETVLRWFLNGTLGLAVVVYALPQSFWRALGLRE